MTLLQLAPPAAPTVYLNDILSHRQASVGADKRKLPREHREGWGKFAFDIFVDALLALIAAVLIDLALHPTRGDARPSLECSVAITLAYANVTKQPRDASLGPIDGAVLSCLDRPKRRPEVRV